MKKLMIKTNIQPYIKGNLFPVSENKKVENRKLNFAYNCPRIFNHYVFKRIQGKNKILGTFV